MSSTDRISHDIASEAANALGRDVTDKGTDRLARDIVTFATGGGTIYPAPRFCLTPDEQHRLADLMIGVCFHSGKFGAVREYVEGLIDSRLSQQGVDDTNTMRTIASRCETARLSAIDAATRGEADPNAAHKREFLADFNAKANREFGPTGGIGPDGGVE
jgi:hypothetical protein